MDNKKFSTQNFYISCVLKSTGFDLIEVSRNESGKVTFTFDNSEHAIKVIRQHLNNELKVKSLELIEAINQLKTRIYSGV